MARVERVSDRSYVDNLLASYEKKYPKEIANWREPMRNGALDGSRVLIRYVPEAPPAAPARRARSFAAVRPARSRSRRRRRRAASAAACALPRLPPVYP